MANYNYHCFDCEKVAFAEHADKLIEGHARLGDDDKPQLQLPAELYEELVLFETSHAMQPTEEELHEATKCPRCHGHNCEKSFYGVRIHGYVKGYGWLDRAGAKRDMNRFKLNTEDPYAQYRVPGEVDHINNQLNKEGQHDPKRRHYLAGDGKELKKAIAKATSTPPSYD